MSDRRLNATWTNAQNMPAVEYRCWCCENRVASSKGLVAGNGKEKALIAICPNCRVPTFFRGRDRFPDAPPGDGIKHLPQDVEALRDDARMAFGAGSYTATVLVCRKILMHVTVANGAKEDESFAYYVKYLHEHHWIPPSADKWVGRIREVANEANHEIVLMRREDAEALLLLVDMMLRHIFELPNQLPPPPPEP